MTADFTEVIFLGEEAGLRSKEIPFLCDEIPLVDLHALGVSMECELVSGFDLNAATLRGQFGTV